MSHFLRLAAGIDTMPVLLELNRAPWLWDQNPTRRLYPNTPHADMRDIWVRFRPAPDIAGPQSHREEYRCEFWPAWDELPSLRPLVFGLMAWVSAVELGSILITKLPPGGVIRPHSDAGCWAPEFYNCKLHITLSGQSLSWCEEENVFMSSGEVWTFDNLLMHSVENQGDTDRIVCIVSMRTE